MSVVVVITKESEIGPFIRWGSRFAVSRGEPLLIQVVSRALNNSDPVRISPTEQDNDTLVEAARLLLREVDCEGHLFRAGFPLTLDECLYPEGKREQEWRASLVITGKPHQRSSDPQPGAVNLSRQLLEGAPCDVLILRAAAESGRNVEEIVVASSGGPHARHALKHATQIATDTNARVKALYVQRHHGEDAAAVGRAILDKEISAAGLTDSTHIDAQVILRDSIHRGLADALGPKTDLVLVGSSNRNFIRRILFGTLPDSVFKQTEDRAVGVLRAAPERSQLIHRFIARLFDQYVPQLSRTDRIKLFEGLQVGSTAGMDFITLIALATAIAALGLIQNSAAVVIGAMLVAPLMTPMLGAGLGLLQGNILLVREAVTSIVVGFSLSLGIGVTFGLLTPGLIELTPELQARCAPNILDLLIALLSGVAAAYALARPGLLGALPGVAIAAALVPPIATTGIALSIGAVVEATMAATLFGTNLVAIILSSAATFFVLGVRGDASHSPFQRWVRRTVLALGISIACLAVPLGIWLVSNPDALRENLRAQLEQSIPAQSKIRIGDVQLRQREEEPAVEIELFSSEPLTEELAKSLTSVVHQHLKTKPTVRIITYREWRSTR